MDFLNCLQIDLELLENEGIRQETSDRKQKHQPDLEFRKERLPLHVKNKLTKRFYERVRYKGSIKRKATHMLACRGETTNSLM